jgi:transcriptional regulator with XRE-family HTH domain
MILFGLFVKRFQYILTDFFDFFFYRLCMSDDADLFWENVKQEIKHQNTTQEWVAKKANISFSTFQGWIAKGLFPRVNEAAHIATALNVSVDFLVAGAVKDNGKAIVSISREITEIYSHLEVISQAVRTL